MKTLYTSLILATMTLSASASASSLGVSISEKPRSGIPQIRLTTIDVVDKYFQNSNASFKYNISNYGIRIDWTTNQAAKGGCYINYDVNKDNSTNFNDQTAKRRYNTTKTILTNLKQGDQIFIQSSFGNDSASCDLSLKHTISL